MRSITLDAETLEKISPDRLMAPPPEFIRRYQALVGYGATVAKRKSCVFVGLARNVGGLMRLNASRIESLANLFGKSAVLVVENDSTDGTKEILQQWAAGNPAVHIKSFNNGRPHLTGFEPERVANLAEYRNIAHEIVRGEYSEFDYVCVLDTDVWGGYAGLETAVAWHAVNESIGWTASVSGWTHNDKLLHYDQWAFRRYGWETRFEEYFNYWLPPAGSDLIPVRSAFGGMCVYKMGAFLAGRYSGGDCEHVQFHKSIRRAGFMGYLNPSQRVFITAHEEVPAGDMHGDVCQTVD